ncbi:MAG TPA: hypothetical protein VHP36_02570 [Chitinispirillaceae bacterium]|nr:hypothetical protein [Chitinispirillaceae bacterium]
MRLIFSLSAIIFFLGTFRAWAAHDITASIVAGAETHGMIEACDCPNDPGGGLLKRSSIVNSMGNRNNLLLLDAGGFCAGGIYDSYSEGRAGDSVRSILTLRGMGKIGYDAVAIGDEELQFGGKWIVEKARTAGITLISANCFDKNDKPLTTSYILIKKADKIFAITALTTNEILFPVDTTITVGDPVKSLSKIWKEMVEHSDYQIILSHLGQDKSELLADSFPDCDLIINGHRKSDQNPVLSAKIPLMQFGFQGKSLSFAKIRLMDGKVDLTTRKWLYVDSQTPDDSTLIPFLKTDPVKSRPVYDLYIMSQCPYGMQALSSFVEYIRTFKEIDWGIQFIGSVQNDTMLSSLHGTEEIEDEMIWLAVKENYPDKWLEFLGLRSKSYVPTISILNKMNIDVEKIRKWVALKGRKEIISHYQRSSRLNINASPTLLLNNTPLDMQITKDRLAKYHCDKVNNASVKCKDVPQCLDDSDCKKKGKIGLCGENGKCKFQDAVQFKFTVLVADSAFQHPENDIIATTEELFSGATVQVVTLSSDEGKQIVSKFNPDALPFYLFSKEAKQAYNFTTVEKGLIEKNGKFTFKDGIVNRNYLLKRSLKNGSVTLFIDPYFPQLPMIIDNFLSDSTLRQNGIILPVIFHDPSQTARGSEQWFRMEETARWLSIGKLNPDRYLQFLREYGKSPGSSFWPQICNRAGINADSISLYAQSETRMLTQHWEFLKSIPIKDPVVILINNKELVTIHSEKEFETFLQERKR